jgi:hypothetical protein
LFWWITAKEIRKKNSSMWYEIDQGVKSRKDKQDERQYQIRREIKQDKATRQSNSITDVQRKNLNALIHWH